MIKSNYNPKKVNRDQVRKVCRRAISWCKKNMGENESKILPLSLSVRNKMRDYCGYYDHRKNKLIVCLNANETIEELVKTVIHEYTHYLQPIRRYYSKVGKITGYWNNPYEVEARKNEDELFKKCWKEIRRGL
jgi:Zn-dependent peptidase ImmA (M78 family)